MTLLLVLLVLLPWSIWRQMHAHAITPEGLIKLPVIFAVVGVLGIGTRDLPTDAEAIGYVAFCLALSIVFGLWRGARISVWLDEAGSWISKGNRTTITLWGALIGTKIALGTVASVTGIFPAEHAGDVFLFLAFSFVAQNLVVAGRTLWRTPRPVGVTA